MTETNEKVVVAMFEDVKSLIKEIKLPQIDLTKVDTLAEQMKFVISATAGLTVRLSEVIEQARKPIVKEQKFTIDIVAKEVVFTFIGMVILIAVLSSWLYFATRPNYDRDDNDLKYRYIKMKGEASPARISELEDLFEINRDNSKIRQMNKDVEDYERAIKEKITLEEQTRRRQQEAEKLNEKTKSLKEK